MIPNGRDANQKILEFKKLLLALVEKILHVLLHKFQLLMIGVNSLLNHSAEFLNFRVRNFSIRIFFTSSYFCISSSPALISINWSNKIECFLFINISPSAKAACISIRAFLIFCWSWSFFSIFWKIRCTASWGTQILNSTKNKLQKVPVGVSASWGQGGLMDLPGP